MLKTNKIFEFKLNILFDNKGHYIYTYLQQNHTDFKLSVDYLPCNLMLVYWYLYVLETYHPSTTPGASTLYGNSITIFLNYWFVIILK